MPLDTVIQKSKLQPIGAGKVLRKIAGKVIASVLKEDVIKCTGTIQVCAGQEAGIESAIHSMNMMHEDENTDAILPVDGSNAFNYLNRQSFLHNNSYLSPSKAIFVKNCYSTPSRLFIIREIDLHQGKGLLKVVLMGDLWRKVLMAIDGIGVTSLTTCYLPYYQINIVPMFMLLGIYKI